MRICTKCKDEKNEDEFSWRNKKTKKKQSWCKSCIKKRDNKNYKLNEERRAQVAISSKNLIIRNRDFVNQLKKNSECIKCGEDRYYVLDFHHNDDKEFNIPILVSGGYAIEKLQKEIDKCDILCANCHREYHHENGY